MRDRLHAIDDRRFDEQLQGLLVRDAPGVAQGASNAPDLVTAGYLAAALAPLRISSPPVRQRVWRTVEARIATPEPNRHHPLRFPAGLAWPRRAAILAAALLLLAMLAGGAVATSRLLTPVMALNDPSGVDAIEGNLSHPLNLAQTVDGVTITLERGYADANRVVLAYRVQAPDARGTTGGWDALTHMVLTDAAGRTYRMLRGQEDHLEPFGPTTQPLVALVSFDGGALPPDAGTVTFHLSVSQVSAFRPGLPAGKGPPPERFVVRVPGPWTYTFALPVIPGRVAAVRQTATANGLALTLDRVVVTPSETRAYLRIPSRPGEDIADRRDALRLTAGGQGWQGPQDPDHLTFGMRMVDGSYAYSFPGSLYDRHGEWTLTVQALRSGVDGKGGVWDWRLDGPWTFRFVVP